ncbi:MAG: hypothetical protein NUV73_00130 [Candidatus Daviesbacteria bacterium]|nr:hypothetical protein [Candidatus Daviesbacteria bacterium]
MIPTMNSGVTHGNLELEKVLRNVISELKGSYPGNVYIACQSDRAIYSKLYSDFFERYSDNSVSVHNTIQSAVNATAAYRGDIVLVMPDKWQEQIYIADKPGIKIRAVVPGWQTQMRAGDGPTKYPWTPLGTPTGALTGGAAFYVLSQSVEISGFNFDGGGGYSGVYVGDADVVAGLVALGYGNENAASAWIHDNLFSGQSEGHYGVDLEGVGANCVIEKNIFEKWTKDAVRVGYYSSRSNQGVTVRDNEFLAGNSAYGVTVINIAGGNINTLIARNTFRDGKSLAFTAAVNALTTDGVTSIIRNDFATVLSIIAQATDRVSGNTFVANGNATPASNSYLAHIAGGVVT